MQEKEKVNFPEFFKIDLTVVTNATCIANKCNFFLQISAQKEICLPSRNNFKNYLLNQYDNNFTFKLIGEDVVGKLMNDLDK